MSRGFWQQKRAAKVIKWCAKTQQIGICGSKNNHKEMQNIYCCNDENDPLNAQLETKKPQIVSS